MKHLIAGTLCALGMTLSAAAIGFDVQGFGESLNGWNQKRVATYTMNDQAYCTHMPTTTATPGGGMFLSVRVDCRSRTGRTTGAYLELDFDAAGELVSGQVRGGSGRLSFNTGRVARATRQAPAGGGEGAGDQMPPAGPAATRQVVADLFDALDKELARLAKEDAARKQDVFGRLFGPDRSCGDVSAALRHNLNLVLGHVR